MKANVHPNYNNDVKVTCACGNTFSTGSVVESIRVEICYACHPFFTGQQKFVDTLGQVDKFQKKAEVSQAKAVEKQQIRQARAERTSVDKSEKPSLKDLLMQARKNLNS